ncbi:hypothetical protein KKG65_03260 [Patescibacteria group bacterium]|nr:hypothetical protein [Patescibacteria group bacterium]
MEGIQPQPQAIQVESGTMTEALGERGGLEQELRTGRHEQMKKVCKIMDEKLWEENSPERKAKDKQSKETQVQLKHVAELKSDKYSSGKRLSDAGRKKRIKSEDEYQNFFKSDVPHAFSLAERLDPVSSEDLGKLDEPGLKQKLEEREKQWQATSVEWARVQGGLEGMVAGEDWKGAAKVVEANSWLVQGGVVDRVMEKTRVVETERGRDASSGALPMVEALCRSEWVDDEAKNNIRVQTAGARGYDLYAKNSGREFKGGSLGATTNVDGTKLHGYLEEAGLPFEQSDVIEEVNKVGEKAWSFAKPGVVLARLVAKARGENTLSDVNEQVAGGMLAEYTRQSLAKDLSMTNFGDVKKVEYAAEMLLAVQGVAGMEGEISEILERRGDIQQEMDRLRTERARQTAEKPVTETQNVVDVVPETVISEELEAEKNKLEQVTLLKNFTLEVHAALEKDSQFDRNNQAKVLEYYTRHRLTLDFLESEKGPKFDETDKGKLAKETFGKFIALRQGVEDVNDKSVWEKDGGINFGGVRHVGRGVIANNRTEIGKIEQTDGWEKDAKLMQDITARKLFHRYLEKIKRNRKGEVVYN